MKTRFFFIVIGLLVICCSRGQAAISFSVDPNNLPQNSTVVDMIATMGGPCIYEFPATSIDGPIGLPPMWIATFNYDGEIQTGTLGCSLIIQIDCGGTQLMDATTHFFYYGEGFSFVSPVIAFPNLNNSEVCAFTPCPDDTPARPNLQIEYLLDKNLMLLNWERINLSVAV